MTKYQWLIFDADNTLFDFNHAQEEAFYQLLRAEELSSENGLYDLYREINHRAWQELETGKLSAEEIKYIRFERLFQKIGHNKGDAHLAGSRYLRYLSACSTLLDGAEQLIRSLAVDYLMLLITNGLKEVQRPRFGRSPLLPFFEDIIISGEVGYAKPDPQIFDHAFKGRPVDKTQILMIGDSLSSDIAGGQTWGIDTCWFNPGQTENRTDIIPTYEVTSFRVLQNLLGFYKYP